MQLGGTERFLSLYRQLGLSDLEALAVMLVVVGYESNIQPSFSYLREKMTAGEKELAKIIARFVERGWLRPVAEGEGEYDGLKLLHLFNQWIMTGEERQGTGGNRQDTLKVAVTEADLIEAELWFERSFRARLTPMQKEEVHRLVKAYGKDLVIEALRQAVLNNKLTLSYIGSILRRWKREGLRTVFEVRKALEKEDQRHEQRGELKARKRGAEDADRDQYEELMELLLSRRGEQKDGQDKDCGRKNRA